MLVNQALYGRASALPYFFYTIHMIITATKNSVHWYKVGKVNKQIFLSKGRQYSLDDAIALDILKLDKATTKEPINVRDVHAEYLAKFGKEVPRNKKNDKEWIIEKLNEEVENDTIVESEKIETIES